MRCAIYARVSDDKRQDASNQLTELREYAKRRDWEIVAEYIDGGSGSNAERPRFKELFTDASRRKFDVVLVWALDRFSREGIPETFAHIQKLREHGVEFESYTEQNFRTMGVMGELMLAFFAAMAKFERQRLIERINAGLERARRQGTRSGNAIGPPRKIFDREEVRRLHEAGISNRQIAKRMGIDEKTVRRTCDNDTKNALQ
jgi:DNA invertase Pin-like site-specific DNA recombinase